MTKSKQKINTKECSAYEVKAHQGFRRPLVLIKISESLISLEGKKIQEHITPNNLKGWEFCDPYLILSFVDQSGIEKSYTFEFNENELFGFQKLFLKFRLRYWFSTLSNTQEENLQFKECPSCHLSIAQSKKIDSKYTYCPECTAIFSENGDLHTETKKGKYNFCKEGFFLALWPHRNAENLAKIKAGSSAYLYDSLYFRTKSYLLKILSHFIWLALWAVLFALLSYFQAGYMEHGTVLWKVSWGTSILLLTLGVFHLICIGSYHSYLMMRSVLSKYFRPESIEKKLKVALKGNLEALLEEKDLLKHPGYLFNVARVCLSLGKKAIAKKYLKSAVDMCPNHPFLRMAFLRLLKGEEAKLFKDESLKFFSSNLFLPLKEMEERVEWPNL